MHPVALWDFILALIGLCLMTYPSKSSIGAMAPLWLKKLRRNCLELSQLESPSKKTQLCEKLLQLLT